jgi:hypothetical protein
MITAMANQMKSCELKIALLAQVALTTGTASQISASLPAAIVTAGKAAGSNGTQFTRATVYGYKAVSATGAPTNNAQTLYIGYLDTNNVFGNGATKPVFLAALLPGQSVELVGDFPGTKFDFQYLYVTGTTGDYAIIEFEQ